MKSRRFISFASFEANIRTLLARGLVAPMRRRLFSALGLKVAASFTVVGLVALSTALIKAFLKIVSLITPQGLAVHFERFELRSPLHRFASRTSLLEAVLDDALFHKASLTDLPGQAHLVINATELRTGSAFRFGTMEVRLLAMGPDPSQRRDGCARSRGFGGLSALFACV